MRDAAFLDGKSSMVAAVTADRSPSGNALRPNADMSLRNVRYRYQTASVPVNVRYLLANGPPLEKTYMVPAESRFNVWANAEEFPSLGKALAISHRTVEIYRARLMRKYKASTTADLVHKLMVGE